MRKSLVSLSLVAFALAACKDSNDPGAGPPTTLLVLAGGATQAGVFGQPIPIAPTVLVTDASNRPVPGALVTFTVTAGGGTLNAATQTTGANGNASVAWTMGNTFGNNVLTASVAGLPSVTFNATAIAPAAGVLAFNLIDPPNDTLTLGQTQGPKGIDLLSIRGDYKSDSLIVTATFSAPVVIAAEVSNGLGGFLDFDIDDNAQTGLPFANDYGNTATLGVEYELDFFGQTASSMLFYSLTRVLPVAAAVVGNTVIARIPMSLMAGEDGNFAIAGVFGTRDRATDIFPNAGQTVVRRAIGAASASNELRTLRAPLLSRGWRRPFSR